MSLQEAPRLRIRLRRLRIRLMRKPLEGDEKKVDAFCVDADAGSEWMLRADAESGC